MNIAYSIKSTARNSLLSLLAGLALCSTSTLADEEVITWRVQSHSPQASWTYINDTLALAERIKENTNGRLQLEVYAPGALFHSPEIFNAVKRGIIPMGTVTPGYIRQESELASIAFGLPGSFKDAWEAAHFFFNVGFEEAFRDDLLENHGVYWATTVFFPTEMVVKQPIESLEDFESMKIRSSGTLQKFLSEAGTSATMIPGEEVYQALSSGVVDGAHWGAVTGAASLNLYEVADYHVKPAISFASNGVLINKEAMDRLPSGVRRGLVEALKQHVWATTAHNEMDEMIMLRQMQKKHGVEVIHLPDDVQSAMNKAALKIWAEAAGRGDKAARQIDKMKSLLTELGHI